MHEVGVVSQLITLNVNVVSSLCVAVHTLLHEGEGSIACNNALLHLPPKKG